jgi:hypothetical protein
VPPTPPGAVETAPAPQPALLDGALELTRIRQLLMAGDSFGAAHQLEALHPKLAESGQMHEAWQATDALLTLEPNNLRVLQQRVEYAAASGDQDLTLRSYLDLGRYLEQNGSEAKARVIFQRVLDLDPHNAEAKSFIRAAAPPKSPPVTSICSRSWKKMRTRSAAHASWWKKSRQPVTRSATLRTC